MMIRDKPNRTVNRKQTDTQLTVHSNGFIFIPKQVQSDGFSTHSVYGKSTVPKGTIEV